MVSSLMFLLMGILAIIVAYNLAMLRFSRGMKKIERELEESGDIVGKYQTGIAINKQGQVVECKRVSPAWYARLARRMR